MYWHEHTVCPVCGSVMMGRPDSQHGEDVLELPPPAVPVPPVAVLPTPPGPADVVTGRDGADPAELSS